MMFLITIVAMMKQTYYVLYNDIQNEPAVLLRESDRIISLQISEVRLFEEGVFRITEWRLV